MTKYLCCVLAVILLSVQNDKKNLLCHKWIQFAFKSHKEASLHYVARTMAKECQFKSDGSYIESTNNNTVKSQGNWYLNPKQSKFDLTTLTINGLHVPVSTNPTRHYNHIILKLTRDTLIYGEEDYYGKDYVYGHDDWYFVREK